MKVRRIVLDIATDQFDAVDKFHRELLGLELVMDHGWLRTYASGVKNEEQAFFRRLFKRCTGITPAEYRRLFRHIPGV